MGAWGYEPMENDDALEWLANKVEAPLVAAIKGSLQAYLDQTEKDDVRMSEAEAAAALQVDLGGNRAKMKYTDFSGSYLGYAAKENELWLLAAKAIAKMMEEEQWLSGWNKPQQKLQVLKQLLSELQRPN
jgi:hypothetical protein